MKSDRIRKAAAIAALIGICLASAVIYVRVGIPLTDLVKDPERLRAWMEGYGWKSRLVYMGVVCLQVIVAVIPGEPVELAGGYLFGGLEGTLLCMGGIAMGSAIVFGAVRVFGRRLVEVFFSREKIDELRILKNPRKLGIAMVVLMILPGTPKDLLTYCAGLTPVPFGTWMLISTICRIPSVVTSTVGGGAIGSGDYLAAAVIFGVTTLLCIGGLAVYAKYKVGKNDRQ